MIIPTDKNILPIGRRLLVQSIKQAEKTSSGLELSAGDGNATAVYGKVIRAGEGCNFKEGDLLMWRRYSLDVLTVTAEDGEHEYNLIEESEVIAFVKPDTEKAPDPYKLAKEKRHADEETASVKKATA